MPGYRAVARVGVLILQFVVKNVLNHESYVVCAVSVFSILFSLRVPSPTVSTVVPPASFWRMDIYHNIAILYLLAVIVNHHIK